MTSEEDVSLSGSPLLTRKRFGSFSGENMMREDGNYSSGIFSHISLLNFNILFGNWFILKPIFYTRLWKNKKNAWIFKEFNHLNH